MTPIILQLSLDKNPRRDHIISFVGKRQVYIDYSVLAQMSFLPQEGETAGLVIMQAMHHQIRMERICENKVQLLCLILSTTNYDRPPYIPGFSYEHSEEILASVPCEETDLIIGFQAKGQKYDFVYGTDQNMMNCLMSEVDCGRINPEYVGGMVGTLIGLFATANGKDSANFAEFDWFKMVENK